MAYRHTGMHPKPSVLRAVEAAWEWMIHVLFSPFLLQKWCILGFCAFLAYLGQNASFHTQFSSHDSFPTELPDIFAISSPRLILIIGIAFLFVLIAVLVLMLIIWLSSYGHFLFLDGVVRNRPAIIAPWKMYKTEARRLCLFRYLLILIDIVVSVAILTALIVSIYTPLRLSIQARDMVGWQSTHLLYGIISGSILSLWLILMSFVRQILYDFVVPIMYRYRLPILMAWSVVWHECVRRTPLRIILFYMAKALLAFIGFILFFAFSLLTCCLFCCLSSIPYVGAVVILPYTVFMRAYSLFFLRQYGEKWDVFAMRSVVQEEQQPENDDSIYDNEPSDE